MVKSRGDLLIDLIIDVTLVCVALLCVIPMLYVLTVSITPYSEVQRHGGFVLIPGHITFTAYNGLMKMPGFINSFFVTVFITAVGTALNLVTTILIAYPLSRSQLPGKRLILNMIIFTMMFSGGMIPTFLIVRATQLLNKVWAMIIPQLVWSYNLLIMRSFFRQIPEDLFESARIDGAGEWRILVRIITPLSVPVIITMGLFYGVGHWNEYMQAILYITKRNLRPIQVVVHEILAMTTNPLVDVSEVLPTLTTQMASIVIAAAPIILVYPFLQRYFIKGVMLGSIKG